MSVDENVNDVEVDCMHSVRNRYDPFANVFFWPQPVRDICFYLFEHIITLIAEPRQLSDRGRASRHFSVEANIWEEVKRRFN